MAFDVDESRRLRRELDEAQRELRALLPPAHELRAGAAVQPHVMDEAWIERWQAAKERRDAAERAVEEFWRARRG